MTRAGPPPPTRIERVASDVEDVAERADGEFDGKVWVDADGTRWRLRGDGRTSEPKRAERLLHDPATRVLLDHGPAPVEVPVAEREALWSRVRYYLEPRNRPAPGEPTADHTEFWVYERVSDDGRHMLVIKESC
jgi:hypothetical protein